MSLLAEIDVDGLVAARKELGSVIDLTEGELESLSMADGMIETAISDIEEEGSLEDSLSHSIDLCEDAVELIDDQLQLVIDMHRAGRIRRSNETVEVVVEGLRAALRHIAEWADEAHSELRGLR